MKEPTIKFERIAKCPKCGNRYRLYSSSTLPLGDQSICQTCRVKLEKEVNRYESQI